MHKKELKELTDLEILKIKGVPSQLYALDSLRLLTIDELAVLVGEWCTRHIIDGWIRKHGLKATKAGKRVVISVENYRNWVNENEIKIFRIS